jgi:hypothetical protein
LGNSAKSALRGGHVVELELPGKKKKKEKERKKKKKKKRVCGRKFSVTGYDRPSLTYKIPCTMLKLIRKKKPSISRLVNFYLNLPYTIYHIVS